MSLPPSQGNTVPVVNESLIQYKYASAHSSGVPTVSVKLCFLNFSTTESILSAGMSPQSSVLTAPGATTLTRMGFRSMASPRPRPSMPDPIPVITVHLGVGLHAFVPLVRVYELVTAEFMYLGRYLAMS